MERRNFVKNMATISAATILAPEIAFGSRSNSAIQVGIIGCGGRGTSVISAMSKHTNTNIIAMADLFDDQLQEAKPKLNKLNADKGFPAIKKSNTYQGSKAYLELLENKDIDAVLISSPTYTHPEFIEAAVAAGKHIYCEKPVALDVEGCKRVEAVGDKLNGKLSLVIGLQIRYATPYMQMVKRIQQGGIGEVVNAQLNYFSSAVDIKQTRNMSDDEARIRNHFHFKNLSGGILLDQGVHMLDVCNWTLQKTPTGAICTGGRMEAPDFGDTWNNYQVLYQYPGDVNVSFHSTQLGPEFGDVTARFIGTKGIAEAHYSGGVYINGETPWDSGILKGESELTAEQRAAGVFDSSLYDATPNKVKAFIQSIENRNYLNETNSGSDSTLTAILGRQAGMAQQQVSWDEMISSNENIDPKLDIYPFNG